jgi:hypothetical protein
MEQEENMRFSIAIAGLLALGGVLGTEVAQAHPDRIILLRHGEKTDGPELCSIGALRAQALSDEYLGKGAPGNDMIFGKGRKPDAFFAITPHTKKTATPSAQSWGEQLTAFSVDDPTAVDALNEQTRKAAAALDSADYDGKVVVVVWEHHRIANKELNQGNATFWSLLNLGAIPKANTPESWKGVNYDFIWVVDYTKGEPRFKSIPQEYTTAAYAPLPNNGWGDPVDASKFPAFYANCEHKDN